MKKKALIALQLFLFIWYVWFIGYNTATYPSLFWLIAGTIINTLALIMLMSSLFFNGGDKKLLFITSLILFCWYCWRIPNDTSPSIVLTLIYEFVDVTTLLVAGLNIYTLLKGYISNKGKTAAIAM